MPSVPEPGGRPRRPGATLLELVVVLVVVLILASLLPAVQATVERARQAECGNRLRGLGVALHQYHDAFAAFPPGGLRSQRFGDRALKTDASAWAVVLPYTGHSEVAAELNFESNHGKGGQNLGAAAQRRLAGFVCPSDSEDQPGPRVNFRVCLGTGAKEGKRLDGKGDMPAGPFSNLRARRSAEFLDGLSSTLAVSERTTSKASKDYDSRRDAWLREGLDQQSADPDTYAFRCGFAPPGFARFGELGFRWSRRGLRDTAYNHVFTPNASIPDCTNDPDLETMGAVTARSNHPGLVHGLLADGAVRPFADAIETKAWRALATIAGGETP